MEETLESAILAARDLALDQERETFFEGQLVGRVHEQLVAKGRGHAGEAERA